MRQTYVIGDGRCFKRRVIAAIEALPRGQAHRVDIAPYKRRRSLAQNACLHGWMKAISDWCDDTHGRRIAPQAWKIYFKREYLGETVHQIPDGKLVITVAQSSAINVATFSEFLSRIEAWAAEQDGLELPRDWSYWEAMGRVA